MTVFETGCFHSRPAGLKALICARSKEIRSALGLVRILNEENPPISYVLGK